MLRGAFVAFTLWLLLLLVSVAVRFPLVSEGSDSMLAYGLLVLAIYGAAAGGHAVVAWSAGPRRDGGSLPAHLRDRAGVRDVGRAVRHITAFLVEAYWPYLLTLALSLIGYSLFAPTERRRQQASGTTRRPGVRSCAVLCTRRREAEETSSARRRRRTPPSRCCLVRWSHQADGDRDHLPARVGPDVREET